MRASHNPLTSPGPNVAAAAGGRRLSLLLVEDDTMIGRAVRQGLDAAGFVVDWVTDGLVLLI